MNSKMIKAYQEAEYKRWQRLHREYWELAAQQTVELRHKPNRN